MLYYRKCDINFCRIYKRIEVYQMSEVLKDELETKVEEVVEEVTEKATDQESVAEETTVEEPVSEKPEEESVIEEAVTKEPVTEETVVEEAVAKEPVIEETVVEEVVAKEPVTEETVVEEVADETMIDYEEHFDDANPWNLVTKYMKEKTNLTVVITGVVNKGALTSVEELRAFIPASQLSLSYVEDLEVFLNKEIEVRVIDVNQSENRLVLSAKDILKEQANIEKAKQIQSIPVGSTVEGVVETLQNYGAFVKLDGGLSGLVHVSQISHKRIKTPGEVLKVGNKVKVKIIGIKDGKISLSIKALDDRGPVDRSEREYSPKVDIPKSENIGTSLGDLFKDIKLD